MLIFQRFIAAIVRMIVGPPAVYPEDYNNSGRMSPRARHLRNLMTMAVIRERIKYQYFADQRKAERTRKYGINLYSSIKNRKIRQWIRLYIRRLLAFNSLLLRRQVRRHARKIPQGEAGDSIGNIN